MARGRMDGTVGRMQGAINGPHASGARRRAPCLEEADTNHGKWAAAPPSPLPVDDGPAQADLSVIEDDGLAGGDGPLRLCEAHLDA